MADAAPIDGWERYVVGMRIGWAFAIGVDDMTAFRRLSGDQNPLHTNPEFARSKGFNAPVVYGLLLASQISRLVGQELPDSHAMLVGLAMNFASPAFVGNELGFDAELVTRSDATYSLSFKCRVTRADMILARGTADAVWRP